MNVWYLKAVMYNIVKITESFQIDSVFSFVSVTAPSNIHSEAQKQFVPILDRNYFQNTILW